MGWSDGIAEGMKDLKSVIAGVLIMIVFFSHIIPLLQDALSQLGSDAYLDYTVDMIYLSFALLGAVGLIGLLIAFIKATSD